MKIRERLLWGGWYPGNPQEIGEFLADVPPPKKGGALAALAPHAGWAYSGKIAAAALGALDGEADTVVVLGGHLPPGMPPLFAMEDGADTPMGNFMIDRELRSLLVRKLKGREDHLQDNTVEVLLPMAAYFFPHARLLWLRLPAEPASLRAGELLSAAAEELGRKVVVLGSTDLTHYGRNYAFAPRGQGREALDWVREVNDRAFIEAVLAGEAEKILELAETDRSSCSPGAVLGTLGFVRSRGADRAELLAYGTSADGEDETPPSFVGYAALAWSKSGGPR